MQNECSLHKHRAFLELAVKTSVRARAKLSGSNLQRASCRLRRPSGCSPGTCLDSLVQIRDEILWILDANRNPAAISHVLCKGGVDQIMSTAGPKATSHTCR